MGTGSNQSADQKGGKLLARMPYASSSVMLPDGSSVVMKIDLQEDGGFYVGHSVIARDGGVQAGETCFWCEGVKLGCITCSKGSSPHGNCVDKTIKCEKDSLIGNWNPANITDWLRGHH
jgi:hypothetical protein